MALALVLLLSACGTLPPHSVMPCRAAPQPRIDVAPDGRTARTRLSVLTYNIEGLGWPARSRRAGALRQIGDRLAAMRDAGQGPDILLFQEVFSGAAKKAVGATGYPAIVSGPRRTTRPPAEDRAAALPGRAKVKRGEWGLHLVGSGLVIASRYPIVASDLRAYGRRSCAGLDCLSNKGVVLARVTIPGVPVPVDVYNTHMNSRQASRAPAERRGAAHERQSREAARFIGRTRDDASPTIFGGDFNMRHSDRRWSNFSRYPTLKLVHEECARADSRCDVRVSWDGDAPWMDTQDLQFFSNGRAVAIRPVRVETLFDGGPSGSALSDHDGFLVTYQLSWPTTASWQGC